MKSTKHLLLIIFALISISVNAQEAPPVTINVATAGTLPNLISSSKKYQITNLTLTGFLNGTDIRYIREMAGSDLNGNITEGKLSVLDLSKARIVAGGNSFYYKDGVEYYSSLDRIGNYVFWNCKELTSVTIPNSVTTIGKNAFSHCTGLTSISIPGSVTMIGNSAFSHCTGLTSISIPNSVTTIEGGAFSDCTGLTSISIPNSVTTIEAVTFGNCKGLTSMTIPNSVTTIRNGAFIYCTGLTSISIPASVTKIEDYAFSDCTGLTSISIPGSVTTIGNYAFIRCTSLKEIIVLENSPTYKSIEGVLLSKDGTKLIAYPNAKSNTYTIPASVTKIEDYAFSHCTGLTSISIPGSVTTIGNYAFSHCTGLTSISIPGSVTTIGNSAFIYCTGLTSISIPGSVTTIGDNAFIYCSQIKQIYCKGTTPPKIYSKTFSDIYNTCELYVPKGAYSSYWVSPFWGQFKNIIEQVTTAIIDIEASKTNVYTDSGSIIVKGGKLGDSVDIYSISGSLLHKIKITDDIVRISVAPQSLYIVKTGDRSFKIAL